MVLRKIFYLAIIITVAGCSLIGLGGEDPTELHLTIKPASKINPNFLGEASPVVVRLYELSSNTEFNSASFMSLLTSDKSALGNSMLTQKTLPSLIPGEMIKYNLVLNDKTLYLGVLIEYADFNNSIPKGIVSIVPFEENNITLNVNSMSMTLDREGD
ncbi:type VI secretion system lipoprotein TssJ [uncultured Shewanella sp.]|uniref:type VI secretion system lipoprotein TssJ n=1 Tax=uncultured Shewanella sp. TaxID=173975 RepID=UPI002612591C|nr:type VI secretion system lipoprotein TssJ [uncultured Shewanella sp.]